MSVADKGQVLFLNFNYVEELEMSCDFWQLLLYVFVLCLRISTACPVTWYHCLVLVSESAHCSPAPWLFLYCSFFSRFVPLGNWWHESTVTDCRSCCDLSTMWPILIRPVVFIISLELKNLRVYFRTNGLKKKGKRVQKSNTQVYDSLTQILTVKTAMALKCQKLGCAFRANSGSGKKVLKLHWTAVTLPCKQCSFTFRDARPGGPWKLVWEEK